MILLPLFVAAAMAAQAPAHAAPSADQDHSTHDHDSKKGSAEAGPARLAVTWQHTWEDAVREAKKLPNGRIIINLADEDCGECERMDSLVIPSTSFYSFAKGKVPVRLLRSSEDGKKIAEHFGITRVPAWLVVTPDLILCGLLVGSESQAGWFNNFIETEKNWAAYRMKLDQEQKTPGDTDLVFAIAEESYKRGSDLLSESRFRRLSVDERVKPAIRDQSLAYLAMIELDAKRIPEAAKDLEQLLKTAEDPKLRERAELRLADVEIARSRLDLAAERLRRFKKDHPASPLVAEADELLKALEQHMAKGKSQ
jgi:hypothetical protein